MRAPSVPRDEVSRLETLRDYDVLDTLPEQALDDLTTLAAQICDVPIALISLVDANRQWFKSRLGTDLEETPRDVSFCGHSILEPTLLVIPDASLDDRFVDNPLVTGPPHMRFYAGAPLLTPNGSAIGTLCVFDRVPRVLTDEQTTALLALSRQAMAQLTLRKYQREMLSDETRLFQVLRACPVGIAVHRWSDGTFVEVNAAFTTLFGWRREELVGRTTEEIGILDSHDTAELRARLQVRSTVRDTEVQVRTRAGTVRHVLVGTSLTELRHEPHTITTFVDITARKEAEERLRESAVFAQSTIDALTLSLCVLDETGLVLATNVAWRHFAATHGDSALRALSGDNFFRICLTTLGREALDAKLFANGVRATIKCGDATFEMEYACQTPMSNHCLIGRVTRFEHDGPVRVVVSFEDVTLRKRAEIVAGRLAAIVESSDDAIIGKDLDGIVTSWNGGATRIFGYAPAEMIGTPITRLLPSDRLAEEAGILQRIRLGGSVGHFDTLRRTRDGKLLDVSITASPIKDATGKVVGVSKVARDITGQKRAEGVLREREEQLRLYAQHSPAAIAMLDRQMNYLVVSDRWMKAYKLGADSIVGRSHYDVFPQLPPRMIASNQRSLEGAVEMCDEDSFVRADGSTEWIRWETRPWHEADGTIGGIIIFTEVITQRKQADAALRASDERMRFALENAEVGIWDYDFKTGSVQWSPTLEDQFGLISGSFPRTYESAIALIHPDDRDYVIGIFRHAIETGTEFTLEARALWADGTHRWLSGAGRIQFDAKGVPLRGVGISVDVTERHSLEEQSQQAQKMEAIGRLAGGVAHDFNNLLTVMLGYCDILLAELDADDERRHDVGEIRIAGLRASSLTRQLLAFSRREILEMTSLDLNRIATEMQSMLSRLIGVKVKIELTLGTELCSIRADRTQMEQVVMNLAVNARDAMPEGGRLGIGTANVILDEEYAQLHPMAKAGNYVVLTVSDSGLGMTEEVKARMFEPFFTTKDAGKGTGLGMATVYGIVERCGGSIDVVTEPGAGTTFSVYFPCELPGQAHVVAARSSAPIPEIPYTVLLVEGEEELREVARKLLRRLGYVVIVAANVAQAVRLFEEQASIDVVLTDVILHGSSGLELIKQLIERRPALKFIYMSGSSEDAIVQDGVLKPGISYLRKPFALESLGEKMRQVLEQ